MEEIHIVSNGSHKTNAEQLKAQKVIWASDTK